MAIIKTISDPTVVLDEMAIAENINDDNAAQTDFTQIVGKYYPVIQINTYIIDSTMIRNFQLASEGFLPELSFSFVDKVGDFKGTFYPKDGDLISVYLKSHDDETFKPIRIDFDILSFTDLGINEFAVRGVMNIPLISAEVCKAYPELTSFELFQTLTEELGLGYASNEESTADSMNWINAYNTYERFLKDSTQRVYKDDRSFYTSFVDVFYYFNLVNVNKQFEEYEPEQTTLRPTGSPTAQGNVDQGDLEEQEAIDLFLTSHPGYGDTNIGIINYKIVNESGIVWKSNGYKRFAQFFDLNDNQYYSFFVDPVTTQGAEEESQLMKGRPGDMIYEDINKYKYLGIQLTPPPEEESDEEEGGSDGEEEAPPRPEQFNVHRNYQYSLVQNMQNNEELKKITVTLDLPTINSAVYRYQSVPIIFYESNPQAINNLDSRDAEVEDTNSEANDGTGSGIKINTLLSGLYVVSAIYYVWDQRSKNVRQQLKLTRREWPISLPKEFESRNPRK